ncbi:ZPR1 zinc finger domain protein [Oesophagostomum dentatum]|uniref:ZPR1 zinc finger domain protein n=1 Tax=Oesophagostomum dentatum TaxID=61180 RepID=A0A0B1SBA6_OESDE|nr:ZPR1 zinc finger domain protein [Oesophagostomum dentatum]
MTCDNCGHKTSEVKSGGSIKDHGCRLSITIKEDADLARDVLKSDTCSMRIPELDLEVGPGALCSRFTTVEGLLTATKDQLSDQSSFFMGDSATNKDRNQIQNFLEQFDDVGPGALCSRFTTVEGLLTATKDQLSDQSSFFMGDSATNKDRSQIQNFLEQFDDILSLKKVVTLVLDDPAGNSYIQVGVFSQ